MDKNPFCQRIAPILAAFKRENPGLMNMQDGAPSHSARQTMENINTVGIVPIE